MNLHVWIFCIGVPTVLGQVVYEKKKNECFLGFFCYMVEFIKDIILKYTDRYKIGFFLKA